MPLRQVARTFLDLKEAREAADDDHLAEFSKEGALSLVDGARAGHEELINGRERGSVRAFYVLVAMQSGLK